MEAQPTTFLVVEGGSLTVHSWVTPILKEQATAINAMLSTIHPSLCLSALIVTADNPLHKSMVEKIDQDDLTICQATINVDALTLIGITDFKDLALAEDGAIIDTRFLLSLPDWSFNVNDPKWYAHFSEDGIVPHPIIDEVIVDLAEILQFGESAEVKVLKRHRFK